MAEKSAYGTPKGVRFSTKNIELLKKLVAQEGRSFSFLVNKIVTEHFARLLPKRAK